MPNVSVLPDFSRINIATAEMVLDTLLKKNLAAIQALLKNNAYTVENLLRPLEALHDALHQFWGPILHLSAVMNSPELRAVINACLPKLSDYQTHLAHHTALFEAILSIKNRSDFKRLPNAEQKSIENDLRDFKLNGVHLSADKKACFAQYSKLLSQEMQAFEENVLDATMAFKKHIVDESLLSGIPAHAQEAAKQAAQKENKTGWLFTLEAPDYLAIMLHADSQALRYELYHAYVTRASALGPHATQFDNSAHIYTILKTRLALAQLLGFNNYAEYSLSTKMVKKTEAVLTFLNELAEKTAPAARAEFNALSEFAKKELGIAPLNAWDIAYASEKLRIHAYAISSEDLRPYFPEPQVVQGLFAIAQRLYDIRFEQLSSASCWHKEASCFRVYDKNNQVQAHLYFDLYARDHKRGGAWMDDCTTRRQLSNGDIQLPAAYVTCNFHAPVGDNPALLTHDDVVTLFHECGHALQHILTQVNVAAVSGINGIPWDAVEVASQFFENWAWEKSAVPYFAKHYKTHAALPDDLYERMNRAKNFQSALQMMRQIELALFDFRLHMEFNENNAECVQEILQDVRQKIAVFQPPEFNRFQHSFTHIFGGSYGAGYYSYKWAEVMACDAFSACLEHGIFDKKTNTRYKETFLESGGSIDPLDLFITFLGRKPSVDALLAQSGIKNRD